MQTALQLTSIQIYTETKATCNCELNQIATHANKSIQNICFSGVRNFFNSLTKIFCDYLWCDTIPALFVDLNAEIVFGKQVVTFTVEVM